MKQKRNPNPGVFACAAFIVDYLGFEAGRHTPIIAWIGAGVAVTLCLVAIWLAIRFRSWGWLTVSILALLGTVPVLFLSQLIYTCATYHSCL